MNFAETNQIDNKRQLTWLKMEQVDEELQHNEYIEEYTEHLVKIEPPDVEECVDTQGNEFTIEIKEEFTYPDYYAAYHPYINPMGEDENEVNDNARQKKLSKPNMKKSVNTKKYIVYKNNYKKVGKLYECLLCSDKSEPKFFSHNGIRRHIRNIHYCYRYICQKCSKYYINKRNLQRHYKFRHNMQQVSEDLNATKIENLVKLKDIFKYKNAIIMSGLSYKCKLCPKSSRKHYNCDSAIRQHITFKHFKLRFKCVNCPKKYKTGMRLRQHYKKDHHTHNASKRRLHTILIKKSKLKIAITKKLSKTETIKNSNKSIYKQLDFKNAFKKENNIYICLSCLSSEGRNPEYRSLAAVRKHIMSQHFKCRFSCTECNKKYVDMANLRNHYRKKHNIEEGLIKLEKEDIDAPLKRPILSYANAFKKVDNNFVCTLCTESPKYNHLSNVRHHIKLHHHGYRYTCTECPDVKYTDAKWLQHHYKQRHPNMETPQNFEMTRVSIADTTLAAEAYTYKKPISFKETIKKIDNYYVCVLCGSETKKYTRINSTRFHVKISHYGFRYTCTLCNITSKDSGKLRRHRKNEHNNEGAIIFKIPTQSNSEQKSNPEPKTNFELITIKLEDESS